MTTQIDVQWSEAWSLMHEAILEIDNRTGLECDDGVGSMTDEHVLDAATKLRNMGDELNKEYSKDEQLKKSKEEIEREIANLLKEKAQEIQEKYGQDLDNLFRIDPSIFQSGVLGSIYSLMSSRLLGMFSPQHQPMEKMGVLYQVVKGVSLAVLPMGIQHDLPIELRAINSLAAKFLLDSCMPCAESGESVLAVINSVEETPL